jgi:3-oxoacyl-[acyl-carrier-protein] synthase-3
MTRCQTERVALRGIASAVPDRVVSAENASGIQDSEIAKIIANTGIAQRHVSPSSICSSDLCQAAAEQLLEELNWPRESVDALIFTSQTPDHVLPATSCLLQARLGLPKHCAAFDINLGCSGYVYGLWVASRLINGSGGPRRVLLLAGDTISKLASPRDRTTMFLFGDAGTATALEFADDADRMTFVLGTDGTGKDQLVVPAGGFRQPRDRTTSIRTERENGNFRSDEELYMNGAEVFTFTLREVPKLIESVVSDAGWSLEEVDHLVMHQASGFILQHITKRLRIPRENWVHALEQYGNTSCASIPLAISQTLRDRMSQMSARVMLAGFGVGFSWAAAALRLGPAVLPPVIRVSERLADAPLRRAA